MSSIIPPPSLNIISALPGELRFEVFSYLEKNDMQNTCLVSKEWKTIALDCSKIDLQKKVKAFIGALISQLSESDSHLKEPLDSLRTHLTFQALHLMELRDAVLLTKYKVVALIHSLQFPSLEIGALSTFSYFYRDVFELAKTSNRDLLELVYMALAKEKNVQSSLLVISKIEEEHQGASAYHEIVNLFAETEDFHLANVVLANIQNNAYRDQALEHIIYFTLLQNKFDLGVDFARRIENCRQRNNALVTLIEKLLKIHAFHKAFDAVKLITDPKERDTCLQTVFEAFLKAGKFDLALLVRELIAHPTTRHSSLKKIAYHMARAKHYDGALQVIQGLKGYNDYDSGLYQIIRGLVKAEEFELASATIAMIDKAEIRDRAQQIVDKKSLKTS